MKIMSQFFFRMVNLYMGDIICRMNSGEICFFISQSLHVIGYFHIEDVTC